jgi:ribonuclease BN (tRNA processing enzyme)
MSAAEAGELAARAGAGRLVLTHISDELDPGRALAAAGAAFDGTVEIAAEGSTYEAN